MTQEAIIFDVDGTLSPDISWTALTRDLGAPVEEHVRLFQALKNGEMTYEDSRDKLVALWQATGNANRAFFTNLFESWQLMDGATSVVDKLKENYKVCLITGSMDLFAATVATKLGVDDYFANATLQWDEAGNLSGLTYELQQSKTKLEQFLGYCSVRGLSPTDCIVVGDSDNDVALFERTRRGVAIGPDVPPELQTVAWKSITVLAELPAALQ